MKEIWFIGEFNNLILVNYGGGGGGGCIYTHPYTCGYVLSAILKNIFIYFYNSHISLGAFV